ncbi:hypothetical protein [Marinigracilibium pacificum]|uniref:AsmA-like protein n=1 Tax=Marinigracilibium pacificum TaxID=2729599 RepID=A0A848J0M1_9BACT|nr:hypothetical protein [Marinigracilibium pacificum]NMM50107.1 hypothetical protein [Marinigracilibium pacificum]
MKSSSFSKKRVFIFSTIGILLIIGFSLKYFSEDHVKKIINNSRSEYSFDIENVRLSIFERSITFEGVDIHPKETLENDSIKDIIKAKAQLFKLSGVSFSKLYFNGKFVADQLFINNLDISHYSGTKNEVKDSLTTTGKKQHENIWNIISEGILIKGFEIKDSYYKNYYSHNNDQLIMSAGPININVSEITTDSSRIKSETPFLLRDAKFDINQITYHDKDSLFKYEVSSISFEDKNLTISGINYSPVEDLETTSLKVGKQVDIPRIFVDQLIMYNPVIDSLDAYIDLDSMLIDSVSLELFRNKNIHLYPQPTKDLFAGMILSAPIKFNIPHLTIKDASIIYKEKQVNEYADLLMINITSLQSDITNLTNLENNILKNNKYNINVSCLFMSGTSLKVNINGSYDDEYQTFHTSGKLDRMKMSSLNSFVTPLTHMKIDGNLHEITFSFSGNDYKSKGWMLMPYTDLNVELYGKHKNSNHKPIESFLANRLIAKDNVIGDKHFHYGEIKFDRVRTKSAFHFMANSLKTGAISTLLRKHKGLPPNYQIPNTSAF